MYHDNLLVTAYEARGRYMTSERLELDREGPRYLQSFVRVKQQRNRVKTQTRCVSVKRERSRCPPTRACKEYVPRYEFDRRRPGQWSGKMAENSGLKESDSTGFKRCSDNPNSDANNGTCSDVPSRSSLVVVSPVGENKESQPREADGRVCKLNMLEHRCQIQEVATH